MKCKQCGWENPDNYDRCAKCGNVLIRPRVDDAQMRVIDTDRTVIDRTASYAGEMYRQPYNTRPYNAQPYNGQPYNGQPYNGQPHNARPYNMQPVYPDMPQQPVNAPYGQQPYGYPGQNQYGAMPAPQPEVRAEERYCPECDAELPPSATECPVCHTKIMAQTMAVAEGVCPECGAEVAPTQKFCHNCGIRLEVRETVEVEAETPVCEPAQPEPKPEQHMPDVFGTDGRASDDKEEEAPAPDKSGEIADIDDTVSGGPLSAQVPECVLQMIGDESENLRTVCCAGQEVDLYRGNTDPANNTIARDLQARLTFADGKWSIEDCSALQTTFIRPARKMELRDGDIIVMGNREFMFKS